MLSSSQLIPGGLTDKYLAEGGSQASSYVKRLIAQRQVDVNRIKKPSSWLLNVYPTLVRPSGISRDRAATRIQSLFRGRRGRMKANVIRDIRGHEKKKKRKKKDEITLMHLEDLGRRKTRREKDKIALMHLEDLGRRKTRQEKDKIALAHLEDLGRRKTRREKDKIALMHLGRKK